MLLRVKPCLINKLLSLFISGDESNVITGDAVTFLRVHLAGLSAVSGSRDT